MQYLTTGCGFSEKWLRNIEQQGPMEHSTRQKDLFCDVSLTVFSIFPFPRQDKFGSRAPRPQGEWMTQALAQAEMPEIDHRVRQAFQGIVQLTDALES